ncbi:unnamed protein product [Symbiodinium microadriaticum]|nr:unnamed protein product [Symbiodinium microadriaticum]
MAAIIKHSQATFAATPDTTELQPLQAGLAFSTAELQSALATLNIRKAVPRHIAPNAVWKLCAATVSFHLGPCFEHHFRPQSPDLLDGDLQASGQVITTNGIKQGCRAAPTLWVSFTLSVLEHLARHRSLSWVQNILTLFADDFCGHWTITCLQDWTSAISDLTLLLETLETYQLKVNLQKTALLVNPKGKTAKKLLRQHTRQKAGETFLILQVHGRECLLRIKESHTYLGTIISYRDRRMSEPSFGSQCTSNMLVKLCESRDPANHPLGPDLINNDREPVTIDATARAYAGAESQELAAQNAVPLISDPLFLSALESWDQLPRMGDHEADIFAHCMPSGAAETEDSQLRLISKLLLKHEEQLAALRKDTQFVLFFRQDDKSILPSLMSVSREWKAKQAAGDQSIQSSQRTVLINCLLRELLARMQRVVATEPGRESLKKAEWLTSSNAWTYMRWSSKLRKLVADETKEPLVHDEAVRIITELQKSMCGEIIHKFQSTVNLAKLEEQGAQQAIFHLAVSLRGSEATEVYDQFRTLAGLSLTNLAGFSMKVDDQLRPPMAQQLAQMTYGGGHYNVLSIGDDVHHILDDAKPKEPMLRSRDKLKQTLKAMSDDKGMNHFLLRKYGDTWTAAKLPRSVLDCPDSIG